MTMFEKTPGIKEKKKTVAAEKLREARRKAQQLSRIEARLDELEKHTVKTNSKELAGLTTALSRLKAFSPTVVERAHVKFQKQLAQIGGDFQIRILQQTVWTEVGRYALAQGPEDGFKVLVGLIRALDYPWQWWLSKKNFTLFDWKKCLMNQPILEIASYEDLISSMKGNDK